MQTLRNYQLIKENRKLDKKVQEQTKTLKVKNNELKEANEEIQSQFQEIQAQSEEIKSQNEELYWYKERLEKLVEEKTNELALALKKAEESDKLKTAFLQNISHEIRTPMNSIMGFMSLLEDQNPKLGDKFKIITKSFNQLLSTIDDILLLSKLHIGQYPIFKEEVFVNDFLEKLGTYGKTKIIEKGKNLEFKCLQCNQNPTVQIDSKSMQLVFEELIDNAIKYTENGEILIGCNASENGNVEFYVKDSGVGIEKHQIKYIFDAFRKLEVENKLFRGTGAGLAIVKNIINLHNAEIKVNSTPEMGTTFSVILKK
ncbi:MAG: hypothetical protein HC831_29400 [Chloroflexia bacterium]|nr:hypothetical protein [Chloroflexia bacterium]